MTTTLEWTIYEISEEDLRDMMRDYLNDPDWRMHVFENGMEYQGGTVWCVDELEHDDDPDEEGYDSGRGYNFPTEADAEAFVEERKALYESKTRGNA